MCMHVYVNLSTGINIIAKCAFLRKTIFFYSEILPFCFFYIKIYLMLAHYSVSRWQDFFIVLNCQKHIKSFKLTTSCK